MDMFIYIYICVCVCVYFSKIISIYLDSNDYI